METPYAVVRKGPALDLIALARDAALVLRDRLNDPVEAALADALNGAAAQVAVDLAEPALS